MKIVAILFTILSSLFTSPVRAQIGAPYMVGHGTVVQSALVAVLRPMC